MAFKSDRSLAGRKGAHLSWANTSDPAARTRPAREAFLKRLADQVDPDHKLTEAERARRAQHALKSHMADLALKSKQARRLAGTAKGAIQAACAAEAELDRLGGDVA